MFDPLYFFNGTQSLPLSPPAPVPPAPPPVRLCSTSRQHFRSDDITSGEAILPSVTCTAGLRPAKELSTLAPTQTLPVDQSPFVGKVSKTCLGAASVAATDRVFKSYDQTATGAVLPMVSRRSQQQQRGCT